MDVFGKLFEMRKNYEELIPSALGWGQLFSRVYFGTGSKELEPYLFCCEEGAVFHGFIQETI